MKLSNITAALALIAFLMPLDAGIAASDIARANPYLATLSGVKAPELPAQAARLVTEADAALREAVTVDVINASAGLNSSALGAVVAAIAKAQPDMAALAAATAAAQQPKQIKTIVRAAVGAAPDQAGAIVYAVSVRQPGSYRTVAAIATQLAPQQTTQILGAVGAALPGQRDFIVQAQATGSPNRGVVAILEEASRLSAQSDLSADTLASANQFSVRGPALGPPYQPLSGAPASTSPSTTTNIPPGGRDYSAP